MSEKIGDSDGARNPSGRNSNETNDKCYKSIFRRIQEYIKSTADGKNNTGDRKRDAFDWVGFLVNVVMLVTVIVYTGAALRQTKLMRRTLDENRASGDTQERLTRDSVDKTVNAMERQLSVMQHQLDTMQNEQRPWIRETNIVITPPVLINERMIHIPINYTVTNAGHQPAFDVKMQAISQILWTTAPAGTPINQIVPDAGNFIKVWPGMDEIQPLIRDTNGSIDSAYVVRSVCSLVHSKNILDEKVRNIKEQMNGEHAGYSVFISGTTIFPGEEISNSHIVHQPNDLQITGRPAGATSFMLSITTCVQYKIGSSGNIHNTGATYIVDAADPSDPENILTLGLGDKPISHVKWMPRLSGRYAD